MITTTVDTSGLDFVLNGVKHALIGTDGDISTLCRDEARLLATGIMNVAQPKDRKKTGKRIEDSVRSVFTELNENTPDVKGDVDSSGILWYRADHKFLYGISSEASDMRKAPVDAMANVYYAAKIVKGKRRLVVDFKSARPSGQKKAIMTTVISSKSSVNRLVAYAKKAIGKLPASWLATARQIDASAKAPEWIARHLKGSRTTKSITDLSGLSNPESPAVTFGSMARGVKRFERSIQYAVNLREKKLTYRLQLILSGYAQDVKNGIAVARRAGKIKGQP